jgi:hypothetical protein
MLELVEKTLDEIALAIDRRIDRATNQPAAEAGNLGASSGLIDEVENTIAVVAAIGDDIECCARSLRRAGTAV